MSYVGRQTASCSARPTPMCCLSGAGTACLRSPNLKPKGVVMSSPPAAAKAVDLAVELLGDMGLAGGRLGLEGEFVPAAYHARLAERLPRATLLDGSGALNEARIYKTPAEIAIMRRAAYYTDKAILTG